MIDRFLREQAYAGKDIVDLSLEDLLREEALERMFAATWGVVQQDATVGDAQKKMRETEGCQDIFVTDGGSRDDPVLGWLTNRDIDRALR